MILPDQYPGICFSESDNQNNKYNYERKFQYQKT